MKNVYPARLLIIFILICQFSLAQHDAHKRHRTNEGHMMNDGLIPSNLFTNKVVNSGNWSNPNTWDNATVPDLASIVLIPEGFTVNYDVNSNKHIFAINNKGTLNFKPRGDEKLTLIVDTWINGMSSFIDIDASQNSNSKVEIIFKPFDIEKKKKGDLQGIAWSNPIKNHFSDGLTVPIYNREVAQDGVGVLGRYNWDPEQLSLGIVSMGAVNIKGTEKTNFMQLDRSYSRRDTSINLPKIPEGWKVGDDVFVTSTDRLVRNDTKKIKSISGSTLTLESGLTYDAKEVQGFNFYSHIGNLTRNVVFRSFEPSFEILTRRGHTMFMHNPNVRIENAQFQHLGRTDKSIVIDDFQFTIGDFSGSTPTIDMPTNSDGTYKYIPAAPKDIFNQRGRYAFHFHRTFVTGNQSAMAKGNAVWGSPGWGMVHHDGNADFIDNVVYQASGAGMIAESGSEMGIWKNNLVASSQRDVKMPKNWKGGNLRGWPRDILDDDFGGSTAFGLKGRAVRMIDNIAANCGQAFEYQGSGTSALTVNNPVIDMVNKKLLKQTLGFDMFPLRDNITRTEIPISEFRGNIAYNCKDGFKSQNRGFTPKTMFDAVIDDFIILNSRRFGIYFTANFGYDFKNTIVHQHPTEVTGDGSGTTGLLLLANADNINFSNVKFYGWKKPFRNGKEEPGNGSVDANGELVFHKVTFQKSPYETATYPANPYELWGNLDVINIINNNPPARFQFNESGDQLDKDINVRDGDFKVTLSGEVTDRAGTRPFGNYSRYHWSIPYSLYRDYNFINDTKLKTYLAETDADGDVNNNSNIDSNGNGYGYIIEYMRDRIDGKINKHYFRFNIRGTSYRPCEDDTPGLVKLFDDCNYSGVCATFGEGVYNIQAFTAKFPNDKLSSIIIPEDYKVTLYTNNLNGSSIVLTEGDNCLNNFNNTTSSIIIEKIIRPCEDDTEGLVNLFDNCNFSGVCAGFEEGIYNFQDFTAKFPNDKLSSILIPEDYIVTLYANDLSGGELVLTQSSECLNTLNNATSSIKIQKATLSNSDYSNASVSIYPNPTTGIINLKYSKNETSLNINEVIIYDIRGSVMKTKKINEIDQIDLSKFSSGLYFISLNSNSNGTRKVLSTQKIIKK